MSLITYRPNHASYKEPEGALVGHRVKIITCLNTSETRMNIKDGRRSLELITRFYSLALGAKLQGHAPRILLSDVYSTISDARQERVVANRSKIPHAYVHGRLDELVLAYSDERHNNLVKEMSVGGAVYLAYDPYKVSEFKFLTSESLPSVGANDLLSFKSGKLERRLKRVYCYESGILVQP